MIKHTPAPWYVVVDDELTSVEANYQTVAPDVSNSDADLISAAPEMYELLKLIQSALLEDTPLEPSDLASRLYRVIAKAEGRKILCKV